MNILFVYMNVINHFLFCKVGKACTIIRTNSIDAAHVGFQVQKLTRSWNIHPLSFFILIQPLFFQLFNGHIQVFGYPLQVFECISWRHRTTTVRTCKAIHLRPNWFINFICILIKFKWRILFYLGEEPSEAGTVLSYSFTEHSPVVRHKVVLMPKLKDFWEEKGHTVIFV